MQVGGKRWLFYDFPVTARARLIEGALSGGHIAAWKSGVALTQYARGQVHAGATLPLTLTWSVETPPLEVVYHTGTYLLAMDDQIVAQSDGPGFDSIQWQADDLFITWFNLSVPQDLAPGIYRVAIALYTWPDLGRASLVSGENTAFLEQLQVSSE